MRKLIAITLLAIFGLPFATSLFALTPKSEASLPACCRKGARHHCLLSAAERAAYESSKPQIGSQPETCPYTQHALAISVFPLAPGNYIRQITLDGKTSNAASAQITSRFVLSYDRARLKRGPPSLFL